MGPGELRKRARRLKQRVDLPKRIDQGRAGEPFSFDTFLVDALRAGLTVGEFWELTPRETLMAMDAAVWRAEQEGGQRISLAWHIAALSRSKRLPGLKKLLAPVRQSKAKRQPIEERRREFDELKARMAKAKGTPYGR